jgi:hypothetical protein
MTDVEEWLAEATEERIPVEVCLDRELLSRYVEAARRLADDQETTAGMMTQPHDIKALADEVVALNRRVDEKTRRFVFTNISIDEWESLKRSCKASEDVQELNRKRFEELRETNPWLASQVSDFDLDHEKFSVLAVTRCCVEPSMTSSQAERLKAKLPRGEWSRVFAACKKANSEGTEVPKSLSGIVEKLASGLSSITPPSTVSPSPSSEDG